MDENSNITYTIYDSNHQQVGSSISVTRMDNKHFSATISQLTNGQYAKVTYSAKVNTSALTGSGTAEQTGNTVSIPGNNDVPDVTTNMEHRIDWTDIRKDSGTMSGEGNHKTVTWRVVANEAMLGSMGGKTITDTIGYNSRNIMTYSGSGITVNVYDSNAENAQPIRTDNPTWGNNGLVKTERTEHVGETWTYTIPTSDNGHNYKYVIEYTTEVDMSGQLNNIQVDNKVETEDKEASNNATVTPGDDRVEVQKEFLPSGSDDQTSKWQVTINVPATGLSEARLVDYLPHKDGFVDTYKANSLVITGYVEGESWDVTDNSNDTNTPSFEVAFKKLVDGQWVPGLKGTGSRRDIVVTYETNVNTTWLDTYLPGSGGEYHSNQAAFHVGNQNVYTNYVNAEIPHEALRKEAYPVYDRTKNSDGKSPLYKYILRLYNVSLADIQNGFTITDTHDSRLEFYDMRTKDPNYNADWTQIVYPQNQGRGGRENYLTASNFADNGTTMTITIPANNLPLDNNNQPYSFYSLEYYMAAKNVDSMITESINGISEDGQPGRITMPNTATWKTHSSTATVTYEYKGLSKGMQTLSDRVLRFTLDINPGAVKLGDGNTVELTDI